MHVVVSEELQIVPPSQGGVPPNTPLNRVQAPCGAYTQQQRLSCGRAIGAATLRTALAGLCSAAARSHGLRPWTEPG